MKVALLIAGALLLSSCQKEKEIPEPQAAVEIVGVNPDCMCGEIVEQLRDIHTIDVANNCSGNIKRFTAEYIGEVMTGFYCDKTGKSW